MAPDPSTARRAAIDPDDIASYAEWPLTTAADQIDVGFPTSTLDRLQVALGVTHDELAVLLGLASRTLSRRKGSARLRPDESDRVYRVGRLFALAAEALGSDEDARDWLREPNYALGGAAPFSLVRTEPGTRIVERTLEAIRHGLPA